MASTQSNCKTVGATTLSTVTRGDRSLHSFQYDPKNYSQAEVVAVEHDIPSLSSKQFLTAQAKALANIGGTALPI